MAEIGNNDIRGYKGVKRKRKFAFFSDLYQNLRRQLNILLKHVSALKYQIVVLDMF